MSAAAPPEEEADGGEEGGRRPFLTAQHIADRTGGRLEGDGDVRVTSVAPLDRATFEQLTFLASPKYSRALEDCQASVVLLSPDLAHTAGSRIGARVIVDKPQEAMLALLPALYAIPKGDPGIDPTTRLGRGVKLGRAVSLGPYVVLGDGAVVGDRVQLDAHCVVGAGVTIGADAHLYPGVTVYSGASLGERVVVHAGARIGSDGFGYVFSEGAHRKIPHVGRCVVEQDVEIGANTTIDRGSIDDTVIGAGTKIDNLVMIAHNVRVGRLCLIMAQVGIAGSVRIGDGCILAGQVGVAGHHTIGNGARLAAQAGVFGDVPAGETWSGYPARPHREALRAQASLFKLSGMIARLERLIEGWK